VVDVYSPCRYMMDKSLLGCCSYYPTMMVDLYADETRNVYMHVGCAVSYVFTLMAPSTGKYWSDDSLQKTKTCSYTRVLMIVCCCCVSME
jgi:hypothetical protein